MGKIAPGRQMLNECPNCSSIWAPGSEEWDWQRCDACGWPDHDEDLSDDWDDDDYPFDEEEDDDDPNDSRNL